MTPEEKAILQKLKSDFIHYATKCLKIRTKSGSVEPFALNKAQLHIHAEIQRQKGEAGKVRVLILKGRQQGCSTYVGGRFYHLVSFNKGTQAFILTHALDATQNLYKMAQRYYENTPNCVKPEVSTSNAKELIFGVLDSGYKLGTAENKAVGRSATIQLLHGCLSEDSLIVLANGSTKPMGEIKVGDLVMTSTGAVASVKNKIFTGNKLTYQLSCWNSGEPIYLTADHKVLTLNGYKKLIDLNNNDYIAMPKITPKGHAIYRYNLKNKERVQGGGSKHIESHGFTLTKEFGYFVGYYLAEGHIKDNMGYITFTYHKDESFIDKALEGIDGIETSIKSKIDGENRKRTNVYGKFLASAINEMCGRVKEKHIPEWMLHADKEFQEGILRGYLDGDGSKTQIDRITAVSIHERISRQLQRICHTLYGACSINKFERKRYESPTKDIYLIRLSGNTLKKYHKKDISSRQEKSIVVDGQVFCKVKSILERKIEPVWDIEVDHPDHNYQTTTGIVSNSEVAFWNNAAEHAKGIMQAVPSEPGTEIILESTANGLGNFFHQQWQQAEAGLSDFRAIFVPWFWQDEYSRATDEGFSITAEEQELKNLYGLSDQQLNWRRYKIIELSVSGQDGEKAFRQEYPCTPQEAFVTTGEDTYIQPDIVMRARKAECEKVGQLIVGVDPARFGDDRTCIVRRQGRVAFGLESYNKKDTMEVVGICHNILLNEKPVKMFIDIGGLGAGIVDRLHELGYRGVVVGVNAGSSPLNAKVYYNKRAEMWGLLRDWLYDEPCQLPDNDSLHADICGIRYKVDSNSRLVMEQKAEMKKRGIRSPDSADALCLTFALPVSSLEYNVTKNKISATLFKHEQSLLDDQRAAYYGDSL